MNDCRQCEKEEIARAVRCYDLEKAACEKGEYAALGMAIGASLIKWAFAVQKMNQRMRYRGMIW